MAVDQFGRDAGLSTGANVVSSATSSSSSRSQRIDRNLQKFLSLQSQNHKLLESLQRGCRNPPPPPPPPPPHHHSTIAPQNLHPFYGSEWKINADFAKTSARRNVTFNTFRLDTLQGAAVFLSYDMSLLDQDLNLISPDLRPTPPQPNCPQSMYLYNESRKMVAAILSVKNEANKVHQHVEELKKQANYSDRELALKMAETGEGGMRKERVEEYYDLKTQKANLSKRQQELAAQYEALTKDEGEKATKSSKRSMVKNLFVKKTADRAAAKTAAEPSTPDQNLLVVPCGDWDVVLKEGELFVNQNSDS